jgi:type VI secretion system protein ImpJ
MSTRSIHWHDGMFLRPHHFQVAERHAFLMSRRQAQWGQHYAWGLRSLTIDPDALGNRRFAVHALRARLRDGTLVDVPEDGVLASIDLTVVLEHEPAVTVFLAVPMLVLGKPNALGNGSSEATRYLIQATEQEDENTGINPQKLQVRGLNLKLVISGQDLSGLEVLPLARIERPPVGTEGPQLDYTFIPPLLACDGWRPLQVDLLQGLCDRVGKKIDALANQVLSRDVTFDSQTQGDPLLFAQLRIVNEIYPRLRTLANAQGVHPFTAYLELCEIVGRLAIFDETRRVPDLPLYDHDGLGPCFFEVLRYIDALLAKAIEPQFQERAFLGTGLRMQVSMEPAWLESSWDVFIGVQSPLEHDEVVKLLTEPGRLDMKIGSSDRADAIFRQGQAGLRFAYCPQTPRALPSMPTLTYFQVSRSSPQNEWEHVQRTLTLALRLNEHLIAGNIQGQRVLKIKSGGISTTMQFTLYVVPIKG